MYVLIVQLIAVSVCYRPKSILFSRSIPRFL